MIASTISGFVFLLIAIFLGPTLLLAGFQIMSGQKVRLPSIMKPTGRILMLFAAMLCETAGMTANMTAEKLPPKYAHLKPFVQPLVKCLIIGAAICFVVQLLASLART